MFSRDSASNLHSICARGHVCQVEITFAHAVQRAYACQSFEGGGRRPSGAFPNLGLYCRTASFANNSTNVRPVDYYIMPIGGYLGSAAS